MPTAKELKQKHPEYKWSSTCRAGSNGFEWSYSGVTEDGSTARVFKLEGKWYVDWTVASGGFGITGRPEEYADWAQNLIDKRVMEEEDRVYEAKLAAEQQADQKEAL